MTCDLILPLLTHDVVVFPSSMCHERIVCAAAHRQSDGHFCHPEMSPTTQRTPDPTPTRQTTVCFSYSSWNEFSSATIATEGRGCRTSGSGIATWGESVSQAGNQTNHRPATVAVAVSSEKNKRRGGARAPGPGLERFSAPTPLSVPFIGSVGEAAFRHRPSTVRDAMATLFFRMGTGKALPGSLGAGQWGCRLPGLAAGAWHGRMAVLPSSFVEQI